MTGGRTVVKGLRAVFNGREVLEGVDVAVEDGRVVEVGRDLEGDRSVILRDKVLYPAFVDAHTHLIYQGDRLNEFRMKVRGASYLSILAAGGGIRSTVRATSGASDEEIVSSTLKRVERLREKGVGAVEIKTGYGISYDQEIRLLRLIGEVSKRTDVEVVPTLLFHVPPEGEDVKDYLRGFFERYEEYAHLLKFVDVFADEGAFGPEETEMILSFYRGKGVPCRLHADEFRPFASDLAAKYGCVSADHLLRTPDENVDKLARAGVIAVLCPTTGFFLGGDKPPIESLISRGVKVALSSDHNPGTAPFLNPFLTVLLGVFHYGIPPEEAFKAHTLHAADSLLLYDMGRIEPGARAVFFSLDLTPDEVAYWGAVDVSPQLVRL